MLLLPIQQSERTSHAAGKRKVDAAHSSPSRRADKPRSADLTQHQHLPSWIRRLQYVDPNSDVFSHKGQHAAEMCTGISALRLLAVTHELFVYQQAARTSASRSCGCDSTRRDGKWVPHRCSLTFSFALSFGKSCSPTKIRGALQAWV